MEKHPLFIGPDTVLEGPTFDSGLNGETLETIPDYLQNWEDNRVVWKPGEPDDDGQVVLEYEMENGAMRPLVARSELMVITGPQKSRKTLLLQSFLMSHFIPVKDRIKCLRFHMDLGSDTILLFDTEQPKRRSRKNRRRFHRIVGVSSDMPSYFEMNIKKYSHTQKLKMITHSIDRLQDRLGAPLGMLVIDQIADLCPARDVNDQGGVNEILDHLNMWQEMTQDNAVTAVTIHTNRGRLNTNGKLGVMLDQKTDCTFHVDIDHETKISEVKHKEARERPIPGFTFKQDSDGFPRLLQVFDDFI